MINYETIHLRENGKFFTEPFRAQTRQNAFLACVRALIERGVIDKAQENSIIDRGFKPALMPADDLMGSFMWDRAVAADENDVHVIFVVYDFGGWRFFGRI